MIDDDKFCKLKDSLKQFPEMLDARPIVANKDMEVIGGNMRVRAALDLGIKTLPVKIVDWNEQKQKEFIIKDNIGYGNWEWEILANEWDATELNNWGLGVWDPREDEVADANAEEGEWIGMPDFESMDKPYKLIIQFSTEKAMQQYGEEQKIVYSQKNNKTWSAVHPFEERGDPASLKYV